MCKLKHIVPLRILIRLYYAIFTLNYFMAYWFVVLLLTGYTSYYTSYLHKLQINR